MSGWCAVLRPGDWVTFDGDEHQVVAIAGVSVRLRSAAGEQTVVLATHLMGSPGFAVIDGEPLPQLSPFGLLDSLPDHVVDVANGWERHIVEVTTGLPPGCARGAAPRPGYDPATRTLSDREAAKAAELAAAGTRWRCDGAAAAGALRPSRGCGAWSISGRRGNGRATGRADARVVAAVREAIGAET